MIISLVISVLLLLFGGYRLATHIDELVIRVSKLERDNRSLNDDIHQLTLDIIDLQHDVVSLKFKE